MSARAMDRLAAPRRVPVGPARVARSPVTLALAVAAFAASVARPAAGQQFPSTPPAPLPIKAAQFPPFGEATLANGVRLLVVTNHRLPTLSMSLAFAAGDRYDPAGKAGLAGMVAGLLTKGAGTRDADAVAAAIEGVGGSIGGGSGPDFLTVSVNLLSENAKLGFDLMADAVIRPTFDPKEVELARTQALSGLQLAQSQPASIASRIFARELYGAHPYAVSPDPASVKAITRDDLVAFQKARLRPSGALLVVAGDITLAQAKALADGAFRGWTGAAPAMTASAAPPQRTSTEIVLVHRPGSVQSNIVAGNLTWPPSNPQAYAAAVANMVLGGGSDARLFLILREQKGWTYGAYSSFTRLKEMGYFTASAEVRTEVTDSSLTEMLAQMRRIGAEPVSAAEFDAAKSALVGRFPLQVETSAQVAGQVSTARLLGLPADYVQTYRQKLAAVTPATALAAAKAGIQPDRALIVVVGDGAKVYDKLKAIAPVRIVTPDGTPLKPEDLTVKAAALDLAMDRLAARTDSFAVYLQGNAFGYQRSTLEKTASGWKYTEDAVLGPIIQQHTEVTFGADLAPIAISQTGKVQGQEAKIDVRYAAGHAKGSATTPAQGGPKTIQVDADVAKGTIDDNMLAPLLSGFRWAAGAKFTVQVFQSGKGTSVPVTLAVDGADVADVPAGKIPSWKVTMTGGEQAVTFWVEQAAPYRVVKMAPTGVPIEMRIVK
ncbi:MAG TPA: insulinase family protein [Gemmatimonadaceae bacterium]|nr:insulinase family protein [Gemmatimonadaceae bacterium]